jgi:hypothetical protein
MTKLLELNKQDFKEFVLDMVEAEGLDWAIDRIHDNDGLSCCITFNKTRRGSEYWSNIYWNGYKVEMTLKEIEEKLNLTPNSLKVIPF